LWRGALLGVLCALVIRVVVSLGWVERAEGDWLDILFRLRGTRFAHPDIVLVVADDATIARARRWPLPRALHAQVIDKAKSLGAKTIALDLLFAEPSADPRDDEALARACRRAGNVVQAAAFWVPAVENPQLPPQNSASPFSLPGRFALGQRSARARQATWVSAAHPSLLASAPAMGHLNIMPEHGGTLRRITHALSYRERLFPSLALASAAHFLDLRPSQISVSHESIVLPVPKSLPGDSSAPGLAGGRSEIPLDENGESLVNWIGGPRSFPTYSYEDLLEGRVESEVIKGRVVVLGITAAGTYEHRATPYSPVQPAIDLQANALDDILSARPLRRAPDWSSELLLLLVSLGAGVLVAPRHALSGTLMACVLFAVLTLSGLALFAFSNIYVPLAAPIISCLLAFAVVTVSNYRHTWEENWRADTAVASLARGGALLATGMSRAPGASVSERDHTRLRRVAVATAREALGAQFVLWLHVPEAGFSQDRSLQVDQSVSHDEGVLRAVAPPLSAPSEVEASVRSTARFLARRFGLSGPLQKPLASASSASSEEEVEVADGPGADDAKRSRTSRLPPTRKKGLPWPERRRAVLWPIPPGAHKNSPTTFWRRARPATIDAQAKADALNEVCEELCRVLSASAQHEGIAGAFRPGRVLERTVVAVPVNRAGRSSEKRGFLVAVGRNGHDAFGPRDAVLLETLAEQTSLALENLDYTEQLAGRIEAADRDLQTAYSLLSEQSIKMVAAVDHIDDALILTDESGHAVYVNAATKGILREATPARGDLVPQVLSDFGLAKFAEPFDRLPSVRQRTLILDASAVQAATQVSKPKVHAEVTLDLEAQPEDSQHSGEAHRHSPLMSSVRSEAGTGGGGKERVILSSQFVPLLGEGGRVLGAMLIVSDVTAQRDLDRMKTDFVSFVAHELRTPLTTILGYASLLQGAGDRLPDDQKAEMTGVIIQYCKRLNRMISEMLDIARLDTGHALSLKLEPQDVVALCERIVSEHRRALSLQSGFDLVFEAPVRPLVTAIDADRIEQIVNNLVSNAIKYSPEGGVVRVQVLVGSPDDSLEEAGEGGDSILIHVRDEGMGMTPEQVSSLFQKFYRTPDAQQRGIKGTGLGLFLVKQLVEAHGGRITVQSQPEQGTTFSVSLPLQTASATRWALP
jgi:signal transduction histidine kinase/CHASE2 domain-containing sensor protein